MEGWDLGWGQEGNKIQGRCVEISSELQFLKKEKHHKGFLKECHQRRTEMWTQRNTLLEPGGMRRRKNIRRHLMVGEGKAAAGVAVRAMMETKTVSGAVLEVLGCHSNTQLPLQSHLLYCHDDTCRLHYGHYRCNKLTFWMQCFILIFLKRTQNSVHIHSFLWWNSTALSLPMP